MKKLIYKGAVYVLAKGAPSGFQEAYDSQVVKPRGDAVIARCIHNMHPISGLVDTAKKRIVAASKVFDDDKRDLEDDLMKKKVEGFFKKIIFVVTNTDKAVEDFANELATMLMSLKREEAAEEREEKTKSEKRPEERTIVERAAKVG